MRQRRQNQATTDLRARLRTSLDLSLGRSYIFLSRDLVEACLVQMTHPVSSYPRDWMTTAEVAQYCGITTELVNWWARSGRLPRVFRVVDVDAFKARRKGEQ